MTRRVAAAEAKARFSELVARVAHGGERVIIERHGKPVAAVVSIEELEKIDSNGPARSEGDPWLRLLEEDDLDIPDEVADRFDAIIQANRSYSAPPINFSDR